MSDGLELIWRVHDANDKCERAGLSDGRMFQVVQIAADRAYYWEPMLLVAPAPASPRWQSFGPCMTKAIAKAVCQGHWSKMRGATPSLQPKRVTFGEPDNYAIPPYEPTGDEEYDRRARGRVETDGK